MAAYGLLTMYNLSAKIGTAVNGTTWTYSELGNGIENIAEALNEVVQQFQFLNNDGFAVNHVTGMAPAFTLTGKRVIGDAAQDYIFSKKYGLDTDRQTSFQLSYNNGTGTVTLTVDATICNIQEWSGATTDDSSISFEIRFDGAPTIVNPL